MRSMLTRLSTTLATSQIRDRNESNDKCIGDVCKRKAKTNPVTAALQSAGNMLTNHITMVMFLQKMSWTHKPKDAESRIVTAWDQERVVCLAHLAAHLFPSPRVIPTSPFLCNIRALCIYANVYHWVRAIIPFWGDKKNPKFGPWWWVYALNIQ